MTYHYTVDVHLNGTREACVAIAERLSEAVGDEIAQVIEDNADVEMDWEARGKSVLET